MNQSHFDGSVLGLFGYRLLGALIATLSFGILTPWANVMIKEYEVSHTIVDGRRLMFTGTGSDLFVHWIKWFLLTLITFGIYGFWLNLRLMQWNAEHTHFMN